MRIVLLSSSSVPSFTANSIQVVSMASAFSRLGHEVVLLARSRTADSSGISDEISQHYGVADDFRTVLIPWEHPKMSSAVVYTIRAAMRAFLLRPTLVVSRNLLGSLMVSFLGVPVVHESHSAEGENSRLSNVAFRLLLRSRNLLGLVAISQSLGNHLAQRFRVPEDKVLVAHDGAFPVEARPRSKASQRIKRGFRVGYAGSFYPGRGIDVILRVAARSPWATFTLAGNYSLSKVEFPQIMENFELTGKLAPREISHFLESCDVVLAPYQADTSDIRGNVTTQWMSPLKIFQYMASGVPIIASDLPAIREILTDRTNSLLVEPGDPSAWIDAIALLRDERSLASSLSKNATHLFNSNYTWNMRAQKILDFAGTQSVTGFEISPRREH